jgi:uncharacterized protein
MKDILVKRLQPKQDFKIELEQIVKEQNIAAGVIVCAVGSLVEANLRMAGSNTVKQVKGPLEIVSCTGTLSPSGIHVHLSVADADGCTVGGHLVAGCFIYTTIELVILDLSATKTFLRNLDIETGCREIVICDNQ